MANVTIKLTGFKELSDKLKAFGPNVAKNGLRTADFAGARIIRDAAKATAPFKTGLLQANIIASHRRTPEYIAEYSIIVRKAPKYIKVARRAASFLNARKARVGKYHALAGPQLYGRFQEFGTSKMAAANGGSGFFRPALLNNVSAALDAIKEGLVVAVERAAKS
jgi:HK97 gp10 family phage protein